MDGRIQQTDLLAVLKAGIEEPPETEVRLERMARNLADEVRRDPEGAAQAFVMCERDRMSKQRQLNLALVTLGERNAQLEATEAALQDAAEMIRRMQEHIQSLQPGRAWRWPWQRC